MQSIKDACKDDNFDANIFIVSNPNSTTVAGKMDFRQKYGFVFPNSSNTNFYATLAHELGHGIFSLQHTEFSDKTDNINNIMLHPNIGNNYPKLRKWQWDLIHKP